MWSNVVLLAVLKQKTVAPNTSAFTEIDTASKANYPAATPHSPSGYQNTSSSVSDLSDMLREAGLGNADTAGSIKATKNKSVRVIVTEEEGSNRGRVVLVVGDSKYLRSRQGLRDGGDLKRGSIYR